MGQHPNRGVQIEVSGLPAARREEVVSAAQAAAMPDQMAESDTLPAAIEFGKVFAHDRVTVDSSVLFELQDRESGEPLAD